MSSRVTTMAVAAAAAVAVVATVGFASLPVKTHATGLVSDALQIVGEVAPQGWGFFTRDPREPITQAWARAETGRWQPVSRGPNATLENAFGFDRASRLDEYDVSQIVGGTDIDDLWSDCTGSSATDCARRAESERGVQRWTADGYDLRLCGEVLLLDISPISIDFAGLEYDAPTKAIRADVRCHHLGDAA
ncbi:MULTISPECIES: SdpA family antimicrobial peptide system protein [unclassified Curtobacterium]|uniref:SdpA family antimicrobial peptide system protein n=1 Tax=unclassified Curtobacterium TaxID=257496 RepID=UPI0039B063CE